MTKIPISTTEAARNLGDCLAKIRHTGVRFVLMKNRKPVAELGPVAGTGSTSLLRMWEAMREVEADSKFADDLEQVNRSDQVLVNPWQSS